MTASERVIVDSSGWLEYIRGGPKWRTFGRYLENGKNLLLPSIVFYEVYKKILQENGKHLAEDFLSQAFAFGERLISPNLELSILASRLSLELRLPMADSIIYATAQRHGAQLITSDAHFANLPGVTII